MDTSSPARSLEEEIASLRKELAVFRVNLSGKDWLTVEEASFYCGVSVAQFYAKAPELGLAPRNFMGKKLYEKAALYRAIYDATPWARGTRQGLPPAPISSDLADAMARLARYERKKGLTMGRRK
ncbi:MAG: hypothetical protein ACREPD_02000 [Stenotrophomonas sp.]|uniref:hypothetical protein n=1 Tax=Stenotrophomonas sp. TaxID=69392 RepID=UPI003D6C7CAA